MSGFPGLRCEDAELRRHVLEWLEESRMEVPASFRLDLEVNDELAPIEDPRAPITHADVDIRAGAPLGAVHLSWRHAPAVAHIEAERPVATAVLSNAAARESDTLLRTFLLTAFIFMWRREHRFHMHAATAIDPSGRGWLLVGDSHSGKSTTTALLGSRGWQIGTDDIAFLEGDGDRTAVTAFRSPIALRPGGFELLGKAGGIPLTRRGKTGFWPEQFNTPWVQTVVPEIIVFTSVGERTAFSATTPGAILHGLLRRSPWVMFESLGAEEHLDLLSRLGRQAKCFTATVAPDLFTAPRALEAFLP